MTDPQSLNKYSYVRNTPVMLVDPSGEFPILVNGLVGDDSERGSASYWDKKNLSTISSGTGFSQSSFMFVDGDQGNLPSTRIKAGLAKGKADAAVVYSRLKESMYNGEIVEQLQFITHSRGSAFGRGYMQGVSAEVVKLAEAEGISFAYGTDLLVEYSVNLAPHQDNWIDYEDNGSKNINISHVGDPLSGDDATGNVINVLSQPEKNALDQHGNKSHNTELKMMLEVLRNNTDKSTLFDEVKKAYKNYDKNRKNGGKSNVHLGK